MKAKNNLGTRFSCQRLKLSICYSETLDVRAVIKRARDKQAYAN